MSVSTISAVEVLEVLKKEYPDAFDDMPGLDEMEPDQVVAAWYVAETCHVAAQQTGLTPDDVYSRVFEDRDFTLKLTINTEGGHVEVEFIFDGDDEPQADDFGPVPKPVLYDQDNE